MGLGLCHHQPQSLELFRPFLKSFLTPFLAPTRYHPGLELVEPPYIAIVACPFPATAPELGTAFEDRLGGFPLHLAFSSLTHVKQTKMLRFLTGRNNLEDLP